MQQQPENIGICELTDASRVVDALNLINSQRGQILIDHVEFLRHPLDGFWPAAGDRDCEHVDCDANDVELLHGKDCRQDTDASQHQIVRAHPEFGFVSLIVVHHILEVDDGTVSNQEVTQQ